MKEQGRRILTIDDDAAVQDILKRCFLDLGLNEDELLFVSDTADADQILEESDSFPRLIFLNLILGEFDRGIVWLNKVRKDDRFKRTSIIILSAESRTEVKNTCKILGAGGFIEKPFDLEVVENKVREVLGIV